MSTGQSDEAVASRPPSRQLSLASGMHSEKDDDTKEGISVEDDLRKEKEMLLGRGGTRTLDSGCAAVSVGAVKVNGLGKSSVDSNWSLLAPISLSSTELRSSGKSTEEGENKKSSKYLDANMPTTECVAIVAEIAIDTDELEQERDELKRQLSMERREKAEVVMASDVVRMSSTMDLMGSAAKISTKCLLLGVSCLLLVIAGVVVGVVLGTKDDITAPTAAPTVEPFFPSTGSPIGKLVLVSLLSSAIPFHSLHKLD